MEQRCCVCSEPLDSANISRCTLCGGDFHMAWSTRANVKECGHYRVNKQQCGLAFICSRCEEGLQPARENQSPNHLTTS